ncbi:hypothetical protein K388_07168 [Streptomyces sp. KhCrAH-43]|uniref:hypothetical protein n=1 Tax=unclassified Streptomyces TaxID=2593676 RepID=UPI00037ACB3E|nr:MULTISPECIES: hypothetical protein [unclassified Streptomyces]MYS36370.1 hypothetical protein [Streptomyces sp. SID4920]MYX63933.1 hypothetical protein [Streptomyces sp. SID8373]RAJ47787.1 hypothetical protein K388_07168 [Streptomyces sp. KhCrAH-43]
MSQSEVRAVVGPQVAALTLVRALMGGALEGKGLDQTVDQAAGRRGVREGLRYMSEWARGADLRTEIVPVVCALGRTAVAGLSITQDGDPAAVTEWLEIQARTVREQPSLTVEHPADAVVVDIAAVFAEELHESGEADAAALEVRDQRAAELVDAWARPGAAMRDHVELLLCGAWFASTMLAHAFRFDGARMQEYVESHASALIVAGRR